MSDTTTTDVSAEATTAEAQSPVLSVTKGNPTDEELAALLLVVAAASGGEDDSGQEQRNWANRARNLGVSSLGQRRRSSWGWRTAR